MQQEEKKAAVSVSPVSASGTDATGTDAINRVSTPAPAKKTEPKSRYRTLQNVLDNPHGFVIEFFEKDAKALCSACGIGASSENALNTCVAKIVHGKFDEAAIVKLIS
jgi:hypothetical protein